ncbi:hypothetical protein [Streptomyces sp. NPDC088360]|uniref:hypothetical protein n=1 Tax=Streptomyces sp. NPDC088360 TaxID=3154515 RepID=UPI00344F19D5
MSALLYKEKKAVRSYRQSHGPVERWTSREHELFLDLLAAANPRRLARSWRRIQAITVLAYGMALYALAELMSALHVEPWHRLERHLDRVDGRCVAAEEACLRLGDRHFANRVRALNNRYTDAVCRITRCFCVQD